MYFLYSLGGVTFNKCWITLSILNCYSPNFQGFIPMKNALNNQVGMLDNMFLWLVANLKQGGIYFIKQEGGNHKIAWVYIPQMTQVLCKRQTNEGKIKKNESCFLHSMSLIETSSRWHVILWWINLWFRREFEKD